MTNELLLGHQTLAQMLAQNRLTKTAGDQTIKHKKVTSQTNLGAEQTQEINDNIEGVLASTDDGANISRDTVDTPPNCQDLNTSGAAALSNSGTRIETMTQTGNPTDLTKSASYYRNRLAAALAFNKKASAAVDPENFRTGTEVMQKFASLNEYSTDADIADAEAEMTKLASTNPVFIEHRNYILMHKLAEDAAALAESEGIPVEEASAIMDQAATEDPTIMDAAVDEANGEAVADLADAEVEADALMQGIQQLADNASFATGTEVSPDQILEAIDQVEQAAEEMGVPPEALIQAAAEEMSGEGDVTEEDMANADAIMEEGARLGLSPEEIAAAAGDMIAEENGMDLQPFEAAGEDEGCEECGEDGMEDKEASCCRQKKRASYYGSTPRAAYVQSLLHR